MAHGVSTEWAKMWVTQYQFCRFCVLQLRRLFSWASSSPVTYVEHRPPHILAWNHKNRASGFYGVGQKKSKISFFSRISRVYVHISQQRLKIEAYKLRIKTSFIPPHPPVACVWTYGSRGFYRVGQNVSDAIPVLPILRIQLRRLAFLFSWASSSPVTYVGHRPPHILAWNHKNRARGFYGVGQKSRKSQFFSRISRVYVHISQQRLKIEAYKLV